MGVFRDFGPTNSSSRPPKGTSLRKSASFKLSTVKIRWGVWPVGELTESVTDTHAHTGKFIALDRQIFAIGVHLLAKRYGLRSGSDGIWGGWALVPVTLTTRF